MASISKSKRLKVYNKSGGCCAYCGIYLKDPETVGYSHPDVFEVDHLNPLSKGGAYSDIKNLIPSCKRCNMQKGPKTLVEWLTKIDKKIVKMGKDIIRLKRISHNINSKFTWKNE